MARLDAAVSLFWVMLGIALCWSSTTLGLRDSNGPGSGLFPFLAGLLVLGGGVGLLVRHVVTGGRPVLGEDIAPQFWEAPGAAFRTAMLIVVVGGMIIAVPWLGFALAGVLGLPILFRVIAPDKSWTAAIVTGIVAAGSMHLLFAVALGTPLPRGPLGF